MSLPDLLSELAVLLPERVRLIEDEVPGYAMVTAYAERQWQTIFELAPAHGYASMHPFAEQVLESLLREECEARGWEWNVWRNRQEGQYWALVAGERRADYWKAPASTPAEALAAAMVSALAAVSKSAPKLK